MMMVIRGFAEVLVRELPEGGKGRGWVAQIRTASDRAAALGEELLAGARPPDQGLEDITPAALLDAVLPLARRSAGPGVEVAIRAPDDARPIRTNRDQFESLLLSLLSLARIDGPKDTRFSIGMSWSDGEPSELVLSVSGSDPGRAWRRASPRRSTALSRTLSRSYADHGRIVGEGVLRHEAPGADEDVGREVRPRHGSPGGG